MTTLPIVVRELSVAARSMATYRNRMLVALGAILFGGYELSVFKSAAGWSAGGNLFKTFAATILVYCIIVGIRNSADCISREKRDGTLGLLFLTDLKGFDVVIGKLFAVGLHSFYGFLGTFPILGISLFLGGVTGSDFWRTALAILNVLFFVQAMGLTASTFCREARGSYLMTISLCVFFFGILFGLSMLLTKFGWTVLGNMIGIFNPAFPFLNAAVQANDLYWSSFWLTHLIGWGGIAVSSFYLPYSWMEGSGAWFVRFREKFHNWCLGKMEVRKNFRGALIERNPFYWLVSRSRVTPWLVWGLICIFVVGWFFVEIVARRWIGLSWPKVWVYLALGGICALHTLIKFWIAAESVRHFEMQRHSGFLEVLLSSTPLQVSEIIHGQWLALQRQFMVPVLVVMGLDTIILMSCNGMTNRLLPCVLGCMLIMLGADCIAIVWVGMWAAMTVRKPGFAIGKVVWRILVMPWLVFLFFGVGWIYTTGYIAFALMGWTLLGVINDLYFGIIAEHDLTSHFREKAMIRYNKVDGGWFWFLPWKRRS